MGSNYYLVGETCQYCKRSDQDRHIGKRCGGRSFVLRIYPEENIYCLEDWIPLLLSRPIRDEYGEAISFERMVKNISIAAFSDPQRPAYETRSSEFC